jgi:hypothetical protein
MSIRPSLIHAWIPDVEEITLEPARRDQKEPGYHLWLSVRTSRGETFDLLLHAPKKQNLKFRKPAVTDWEGPPF